VSTAGHVAPADAAEGSAELLREIVDDRTREIVERRRLIGSVKRRGWVVRRALVIADLVGLSIALLVPALVFGVGGAGTDRLGEFGEYLLFAFSFPAWVIAAKLSGLYDKDEERADHSTVDDFAGVFHLATIVAFLLFAATYLLRFATPGFSKVLVFWAVAIVAIPVARATGRMYCRRQVHYLQNAVIVGAGPVGQLIVRKLRQHPEYGINVVGFVDSEERPRRDDLEDVAYLGGMDALASIVGTFDVERVVVAFPMEGHESILELVRRLREQLNVQVDIVPRLFETIGPSAGIHTVEGLPLVSLPPARLSRSSRALKRSIDVVGALVGIVATAPLFAYAAWRIKRESPGPVLFRQRRLGMDMREFTVLKFRTMRADTDDAPHRDFIKRTMSRDAELDGNGIYKLERADAVTPFGGWLRRTSLDELPQLINVLKGEMSLVGPRPCIPYEIEEFEPHHFERFLVPQGLTGLWQVTARASSTFGEALDMDVAYARSWSLGLDLALLFKTPIQLLRPRRTA
jgi:exopolysaccharide biosynthesis polyprenyl glycosylphosphotransferase